MSILGQGLTLWKAFARKLGAIQTTLVLSLAYVVIGSVVALLALVFRADLLGRRRNKTSYWLDRKPEDVKNLAQQF